MPNKKKIAELEKNKNKYLDALFANTNIQERKKISELAWIKAWECRDFEIKLYWQRSLYFWGFITLISTGLFLTLTSKEIYYAIYTNFVVLKIHLIIIISLIGSGFSFAWYLTNRSSKYWQENWEQWIYYLEPEISGDLYKNSIEVKDLGYNPSFTVSISKINQTISLGVFLTYFLLLIFALTKFFN